MKIKSINQITIEEWIKEKSVESKQHVPIDLSNFDDEAIETAINLGLLTHPIH